MPPKAKRRRARKARTAAVLSDSSDSDSSSSSSSSASSASSSSSSSRRSSRVSEGKAKASIASSSSSSSSESDTDAHEDSSSSEDGEATERPAKRTRRRGEPSPMPSPSLDRFSDDDNDEYEIHRARYREWSMLNRKTPGQMFESQALRLLEASKARHASDAAGIARGENRYGGRKEEVGGNSKEREQLQAQQAEAFEALYMRTVVSEYAEELDAIRKKEPTLGDPAQDGGANDRMGLLIDALKAGSELFQPDEVALVLGQPNV